MITMKKKLVSLILMLQVSEILSAQTINARTDLNNILTNYILPVAGLLLFLGFIVLVIANLDSLRGKNGASAEEGWMNVGKGTAFIFVILTLLGAIANKLASMSFQI